MGRARILRFLRYAVTALSLTACVLLVVLWVRSYKTYDDIIGHVNRTRLVLVSSYDGYLGVETSVWPSLPPPFTDYDPWHLNSLNVGDDGNTWFLPDDSVSRRQFYFAAAQNRESGIRVPHWFVASLAAVLAAAPWIQRLNWRFSLRTLLIATTLVAVAMGTVIYLAR